MYFKDHPEILLTHNMVNYLEETFVMESQSWMAPPPRRMKETLFTKHNNTVETLLDNTPPSPHQTGTRVDYRDDHPQTRQQQKLDGRPHSFNSEEDSLSFSTALMILSLAGILHVQV